MLATHWSFGSSLLYIPPFLIFSDHGNISHLVNFPLTFPSLIPGRAFPLLFPVGKAASGGQPPELEHELPQPLISPPTHGPLITLADAHGLALTS